MAIEAGTMKATATMNAWKNIAIRFVRLAPGGLSTRFMNRKAVCQEKRMKNCTPHTIVVVPTGVQAGETDRYVRIEPSGEVLGLVMDEPLIFEDPVQVGENTSVPAGFEKIDELRSNAAIITALDSADGPILVSSKVLDYVQSNRVWESGLQSRVFAPDTGPTALRDEQGRIVAVTLLRSAGRPGIFNGRANKTRADDPGTPANC